MTSTNSEVIVLDQSNGRRIFAGIIKEVTKRFVKNDTYIEDISVQDYTRLIDDVEDGVTESYSNQTEKAILQDLFSTYCSTIHVGQYVITGATVSIDFHNASLRQAIDNLAALNSRKRYVDYHKNLHYFTLGDETAPFGLSDTPDDSTTFDYFLLEYTEDLVGNKEGGQFRCWRDGLFSGQIVELTSNKMSWTAEQFLIYEVQTKPIGYQVGNIVMEYTVQFGTKPQRITDKITDLSEVLELEEDKLQCPYQGYITVIDGNIWMTPILNGQVFTNENFAMYANKKFGLMRDTENGVLEWYDNAGTYNHALRPETDGHGYIGTLLKAFLEGHFKELYSATRFVFPEGTDLYDE